MVYYIIENGVQIGPLSEDQLQSHGINASTPVWHKGMPQWTTADQVPELADILAQMPPTYQAPAYDSQQPYQAANQPVNNYNYNEVPEERSYLWLAILACILGGVICGAPSLIFAIRSKVAYGRKNYDQSRRLGNTALICGIIGVILGIILTIALFSID